MRTRPTGEWLGCEAGSTGSSLVPGRAVGVVKRTVEQGGLVSAAKTVVEVVMGEGGGEGGRAERWAFVLMVVSEEMRKAAVAVEGKAVEGKAAVAPPVKGV